MNVTHEDFLDTLPAGWKFDRFKDVASLRNEKTDEASSEEDYLELEDLESGTNRILSRRNTLELGSAVTLFKSGDANPSRRDPELPPQDGVRGRPDPLGEAFRQRRILRRRSPAGRLRVRVLLHPAHPTRNPRPRASGNPGSESGTRQWRNQDSNFLPL